MSFLSYSLPKANRPLKTAFAQMGSLFFLLLFLVTCGTPKCNDKSSSTLPQPVQQQPTPPQIQQVSQLDVLNATMLLIYNEYVDPSRVNPTKMVLGALRGIEEQVAEVLVEANAENTRVVVRVDTAVREYQIPKEPSPFWIPTILTDVFNFVVTNLTTPPTEDEAKKIEYAAINGMLSTLDPHSRLLEPQLNKELRSSTQGHFDGVGMVVGIYKGQLTVIRPLRNTPAWRAGIRKGDRILRIGNQSTINMAITDAVDRLRGLSGTKVEVWVAKPNETTPKRIWLNREEISVQNVTHHLLTAVGKSIGYVRISQFSRNTISELKKAFFDLNKTQKIAGLVLDLRGNPGGLLDQAVKVADEFVSSGTIVSITGHHNREEARANRAILEPSVPMVVLVDGGSASASEILAGALKNLGRAIVLGQRTFGKGSVQNLIDMKDGSGLKLTVDQYLTPGDQSIQSVGIIPDVGLEPMLVKKNRVSLFNTYQGKREDDLDAHLTSENIRNEKPLLSLRYYYVDPKTSSEKTSPSSKKEAPTKKEEEEDDELEEPNLDDLLDGEDLENPEPKFVADRLILISSELLASIGSLNREDMISTYSAKTFFARKQGEEQSKVIEALGELGIDWKPVPPNMDPPSLSALIRTDQVGNKVKAGDTITISILVRNQGKGPAGQVRAQLKSENLVFEEQEFVFGHIKPGETKMWQTPVKIQSASLSRVDDVKVNFFEQNGFAPAPQTVRVEIEELPRPRFAYRYQLIDSGPNANGDGLLQKGESLRLHVVVENVGAGAALKPVALLKSLSGENLIVNQGRFELPSIPPQGQNDSIQFTFDILPDFVDEKARFEIQVYDAKLIEGVTDKLEFPIAKTMPTSSEPTFNSFFLTQDSEIYVGAAKEATVIGYAKKESSFPVEKMFVEAGFVRVTLGPGVPGFIPQTKGQLKRGVARPQFTWSWQVTPPILETAHPPLWTQNATFTLDLLAKDNEQIRDAFVFVRNTTAKVEDRKVFYQSNRLGKDKKQMQLHSNIPLWPGLNVVNVIVRQSEEVQSRQIWLIHRQEQPVALSKKDPS